MYISLKYSFFVFRYTILLLLLLFLYEIFLSPLTLILHSSYKLFVSCVDILLVSLYSLLLLLLLLLSFYYHQYKPSLTNTHNTLKKKFQQTKDGVGVPFFKHFSNISMKSSPTRRFLFLFNFRFSSIQNLDGGCDSCSHSAM